jgi:hypothetical protein
VQRGSMDGKREFRRAKIIGLANSATAKHILQKRTMYIRNFI